MTYNHSTLAKIVNMTPDVLRELIYVNEPTFTRRDQVKRHYRTKGDLVVAVYEHYLNGNIPHLDRLPSLPL